MAFSSRRGRPRQAAAGAPDYGTPELRAKRLVGLTDEPVDRCLQKGLITEAQHRSALHLRWLYTLRYGAPSLTSHYAQQTHGGGMMPANDAWRIAREQEYAQARALLQHHRLYEPVVKIVIFNESPAFLSPGLLARGMQQPVLAAQLNRLHKQLQQGLDVLVAHWRG